MADDTTDDLQNNDNQQSSDDQSQTGNQQLGGDQPTDPSAGQADGQITGSSQLSGDAGTPFQPAADPTASLDDTHPATDNQSNVDSQEAYDAGTPAATGAQEPADPGVADFTPPSQPTPAPDDTDSDEPAEAA